MKKDDLDRLLLRMNSFAQVKDSLSECFQFFKNYFPLDLLVVGHYSEGTDAFQLKAIVVEGEALLMDETLHLTESGLKFVNEAMAKKIVVRESHETMLLMDFAAEWGIFHDKRCTLSLTTEVRSSQYGSLGLSAKGDFRYRQNHLDLLKINYESISTIVRQIFLQIKMAALEKRLTAENQELRRRLGFFGDPQLYGRESGLREVMNKVEQVAPVDSLVLIMGETGSGKEAVANAIHQRSSRADQPFIAINCGAIPETLLDSELFGFEKGAFTGATSLKRGYFEQANGGTIFLDEIGELSLQAQVRLLRLLQTMQFHRVGGSRSISVNVRVIAATNRDLLTAVKEKKFREDLWFRLNVFPIRIPPLRERKDDIPFLANHFVRRKATEMNLPFKPVLASEALEQLRAYDWPGNVRELQNVIERALILSQGVPLSFPNLNPGPNGAAEELSTDESGKILTLDEVIIRHIKKCLIVTKGQVAGPGGAAEILGVHPSTLRGKMRKHGLRIKHLPESLLSQGALHPPGKTPVPPPRV